MISSCDGLDSKEFEHAGGTFRMVIDMDLGAKHPNLVTDYYTNTVFVQIFEGLVSLDPENLKVRPQIAESYTTSSDGLVYTFSIRKNVYFHPHQAFASDDERILTTDDIIHSFELACTKDKKGFPTTAYTTIFEKNVVGAKAFFEGKSKKITGLSVKEGKLEIKLIAQDINFLNKLANINAAITSKKVFDSKKKDLIGTGPFWYAETLNDDEKIIALEKNTDYYLKDSKGCNLPYLDRLEFIVEANKQKQLAFFETGKTSIITSLPTEGITKMLDGRIKDFNGVPPVLVLRNNPLLVTNYYFFNMKDPRFQDYRVRQAFNYAINRTAITKNVLLGQAHEIGIYGIVPPIKSILKNYDFEAVGAVGYDFNPELAKMLLAEAGYPEGKDFGVVNLRFNFGEVESAVAADFADQIIKNLGITINLTSSSFEELNKDATNLKGDIFRSAWSADYNSPETFLQNFYGKLVPKTIEEPSEINQARYSNPSFDTYYEMALRERKISEQQRFFNLAEVELMKNPPLIALWYAGDNQIIYSKVRNLKENPMNYFNFREVYFKNWTKEEYQNQYMK
jgi:ABC-type transport system substrate-binding protein